MRAQANDRARLAEAVAALAAERAALEEAALPLMLEAMWAANTLDIQHTVKAVCQQVCPCCCCEAAFFITYVPCMHASSMHLAIVVRCHCLGVHIQAIACVVPSWQVAVQCAGTCDVYPKLCQLRRS